MKQRITSKQLGELSEKGMKGLRKWWKPRTGDWWSRRLVDVTDMRTGKMGDGIFRNEYLLDEVSDDYGYIKDDENRKYLPLLSIGQMIEFLGEEIVITKEEKEKWSVTTNYDFWEQSGWNWKENEELCNSLWEATKEKLEK